ncbi:MAG: helix-turn-helix domain-containing protein, partial [bacterium]
PGNVRELRNIMERLAILSPGDAITPDDLAGIIPGIERTFIPETSLTREVELNIIPNLNNSNLREAISECERELILRRLEACDGNVKRTAETLGLERSHLYKKMRALGIDPSKRD